jgi:hypothetical protein
VEIKSAHESAQQQEQEWIERQKLNVHWSAHPLYRFTLTHKPRGFLELIALIYNARDVSDSITELSQYDVDFSRRAQALLMDLETRKHTVSNESGIARSVLEKRLDSKGEGGVGGNRTGRSLLESVQRRQGDVMEAGAGGGKVDPGVATGLGLTFTCTRTQTHIHIHIHTCTHIQPNGKKDDNDTKEKNKTNYNDDNIDNNDNNTITNRKSTISVSTGADGLR